MEIKVFEPALLAQSPSLAGFHDSFDAIASSDSPEARREKYIAKMAADERGGLRDVLLSTSATVRRLEKLYLQCPNFSVAIGLVLRAALLSCQTQTELHVPPLLLLGPPGVGKTFFARKLGRRSRQPSSNTR